MPPLEAWEKVYISDETFVDSIHGKLGCITCHGGVSGAEDKETAHEGVVREPDSVAQCAPCHTETALADQNSLHSTLGGYWAVLAARSTEDKMPQLEEMMENHCTKCHTSCGQCHVSMPTNLGGGFTAGHEFKQIPPMNLTCTGCHGSRINDEYKGKNEGVKADVHWIKGGMPCFDCHSADEMHGELGEAAYRYDGPPVPSCQAEGCHDTVAAGDGIAYHTALHFEAMSCQVCHSTTYKNCYSCHVAQEDGVPFYKIEPSVLDFKIGRNPLQSEERPWLYVPVRHVPIDPEAFAYYGEDLLPNFDAVPTWKYATPHTIQRNTPQTETCDACHGNADLFLSADDLLPEELEANKDVIVEEIPPAIGGGN
ncbi:MAG: multiheme c-type cytochrome [Anaerolineae bacterium]